MVLCPDFMSKGGCGGRDFSIYAEHTGVLMWGSVADRIWCER